MYTKTFRCDYQLQLYPFDTQQCAVELATKKLDRLGVAIRPQQVCHIDANCPHDA